MRQSDYNCYRELCENVYNALADYYVDDYSEVYEFAVNPVTYEVRVIRDYTETSEGWIYNSIIDADPSTIAECAKQYFDFR